MKKSRKCDLTKKICLAIRLFVVAAIVASLIGVYSASNRIQKSELPRHDMISIEKVMDELQKQTAMRRKIESSVEEMQKQCEKLKDENKILRQQSLRQKLEIEKLKNQLRGEAKLFSKGDSLPTLRDVEPTLEEEVFKKKIKNDAVELFYSIKSKLMGLTEANVAERKFKVVKDLFAQHVGSMVNIQNLMDSNNEWKKKEMKKLQDLVQKRILYSQNPSSCIHARKLICNLPACGFGCQIHHLGYCLMVAFGSNRTMVLGSQVWNGQEKGWEAVFQPISKTCTKTDSFSAPMYRESRKDYLKVYFPLVNALPNIPTFSPQGIPEDIAFRLKRLHRQPGVWWVGQFIKYLFRNNNWLKNTLNQYQTEVGFDKPIVGVHVRRTDKITAGEASAHELAEYMEHVTLWYDAYDIKHEQEKKVKRRVYLATDQPAVIKEAKENYKDYEFINFKAFSEIAVNPNSRNSLNSLKGIITDIYLLSLCDFIVCTLSSQVCRTAYELMQTRRPDASFDVQSLDDVYYYGGQRDHRMKALFEHKPDPANNEIELRVGDVIVLAGNHWDGYSKGRNTRTNKMGLYPSWKVEDIIEEVKYPVYHVDSYQKL